MAKIETFFPQFKKKKIGKKTGGHCVPMKEVVFGGKLKSSYFETPVGIMLYRFGEVAR